MYEGTITIGSRIWSVDVAVELYEISQGLSGRASLPAGTGMLFDLGSSQLVTVTTEDMLFPIDVALIASDRSVEPITGAITRIERSVSPGRQITGECDFFLEVNANELADVNIGDWVTINIAEAVDGGFNMGSIMSMMVMVMMMGMIMPMMKTATQQQYFTDTQDSIESSLFQCQTGIDDAFVNAIGRAKAKYAAIV